jgi:hypothetical protein
MELEVSGLKNIDFNNGKIDVFSLGIIALCLLFNETRASKLS